MHTRIFPAAGRGAPESGHPATFKGRGTASALPGRFAIRSVELDETGEPRSSPDTQVRSEQARTLITRNRSPDVPFNLSINPYRGCEQGCIYCFARPSHAYLDLSPGIDFETRLAAKTNAPECFEAELSRPGYRCEPIALGINTDAYQPIERDYGITRELLAIALRYRQPVSIVTKSGLILRDLDILTEMARHRLVHVAVSVTTLDDDLKRVMEPRAAAPAMRLKIIQTLREAGVPVTVLLAPVVPLINEDEIEHIVDAVAQRGAQGASYILLRLPHEVAPLFVEWLHAHFPDRAGHVISRLQAMRGGKLYRSGFGSRMRGEGIFADLIRQRFERARAASGLPEERHAPLDCSQFRRPHDPQLMLF